MQDIHDGPYRRHTRYEIFPEEKKYRENSDTTLRASVKAPLDEGSFIYFMRTVRVPVGQTREFQQYFLPDRNPVVIRALRRDTVEVPSGRYPAVVVRPSIRSKGIFAKDGEALIWFSDASGAGRAFDAAMPQWKLRDSLEPGAPSRRHHLALAAMAGTGIAVLSALVAQLDADEHWPLDDAIRAAVARHKAPALRASLKGAGLAGSVAGYVPATALAMWLITRRTGSTDRAWPLAASIIGAATASVALKHVVRRPRPRAVRGPVNTKPSFPSGHATRASAAALAIAYVLVRERMTPREIALPLAMAIAAAAGVSRAYADAHWTTDVIGGWSLGSTAAALAALAYERRRAG